VFQSLLRKRQFSAIEALITRMDNKIRDPLERARIDGAFSAMCSDPQNASLAIDEWCAKKPNPWIAYTARGYLLIEVAWKHRGCDWAVNVPSEKMRLFHEHLLMAEKALTTAYELNPGFPFAATEMITVSMGLCKPRAEMEKWFQWATTAKTSSPSANRNKVLYLQPKGHGSVEELLSFADEVDCPDTPPLTVATTYANIWYNMPNNPKSALLSNPKFLRNATLAYVRSLEQYPYRTEEISTFFARSFPYVPAIIRLRLNISTASNGARRCPTFSAGHPKRPLRRIGRWRSAARPRRSITAS